MTAGTKRYLVFVLDAHDCRIVKTDENGALTLIAVASEDPSSWNDVVLYWPRYRNPFVPEFVDAFSHRVVDRELAEESIDDWLPPDKWVWVDMHLKRIVSGPGLEHADHKVNLSLTFADESSDHGFYLSICLPPWWEVAKDSPANIIHLPRNEPVEVPTAHRSVLYGEAMIQYFAQRVLACVQSEEWHLNGAEFGDDRRHEFTVKIHKDWLLTPRADLDGQFPRQQLHGAHEWIDALSVHHEERFAQTGELVAAPKEATGYEIMPIGSDEITEYFELCRAIISAGWTWYLSNQAFLNFDDEQRCLESLVAFLHFSKHEWLVTADHVYSPSDIIERARRRVPLLYNRPNEPIAGINGVELRQHNNCECPVCLTKATRSTRHLPKLGGIHLHSPGYHLEQDGEWAFSSISDYEDWQMEYQPVDDACPAYPTSLADPEGLEA